MEDNIKTLGFIFIIGGIIIIAISVYSMYNYQTIGYSKDFDRANNAVLGSYDHNMTKLQKVILINAACKIYVKQDGFTTNSHTCINTLLDRYNLSD